MLLRFRCKNFRSIREEQELSLVAAKTRSDERKDSLLDTPLKGVHALRCAAIYGANASGKSNVLHAMRVFSRMVSKSQRQWNPTGGISTWDPFVLDEISRTGETEFQIDFVVGLRVYNYGFRFNRAVFVEEWLKDITEREKQLFRRTTKDSTISAEFPGRNLGATVEDASHLNTIKLQTRPNSLFLSSAAQNNHEQLATIFKWIVDGFQIIFPLGQSWRLHTADYCTTPQRKEKIKALLAFADVGIVDLEVSDKELPENIRGLLTQTDKLIKGVEADTVSGLMNPSSLFHDIKMTHRIADGKLYFLDFENESKGTRTYFALLGPLLDILEDGTLVLIDELEASLHPKLARQLVRIFNDPVLNPKGAQLIFATHDTNLLDLDLMRRDQIWFTEKNENGATVLMPLSDYKPRKDQNIEAAYLHGRFGALPFLDESLLYEALESPNKKSSVFGDEAR